MDSKTNRRGGGRPRGRGRGRGGGGAAAAAAAGSGIGAANTKEFDSVQDIATPGASSGDWGIAPAPRKELYVGVKRNASEYMGNEDVKTSKKKLELAPVVVVAAAAPENKTMVALLDEVAKAKSLRDAKPRNMMVGKDVTWITVDNPTLPNYAPGKSLCQKAFHTIKNRRSDDYPLSMGTDAVLHQTYMPCLMSGAAYQNPSSRYRHDDTRMKFLPVEVKPRVHVSPIKEDAVRLGMTVDGASCQLLIGKVDGVVTGLCIDGIDAIQLKHSLPSHTTDMTIIAQPQLDHNETWHRRMINGTKANIQHNVKAYTAEVPNIGRHISVVDGKLPSFAETLLAIRQEHKKDDGKKWLLYLNTPEWLKPTHLHYPTSPVQTFEEILLSPGGLSFDRALVMQRSYWLDEMGLEARTALHSKWIICAQFRSKILDMKHADDNADTKAYDALCKVNDAAARVTENPASTPDECDKVLEDVRKAAHFVDTTGKIAKKLNDAMLDSTKTPSERRQAMFGIGASVYMPKHPCAFVFVRRISSS